jgi:hypothetical protein
LANSHTGVIGYFCGEILMDSVATANRTPVMAMSELIYTRIPMRAENREIDKKPADERASGATLFEAGYRFGRPQTATSGHFFSKKLENTRKTRVFSTFFSCAPVEICLTQPLILSS